MNTSERQADGLNPPPPIDLTNQFLMAMPGMVSGPFAGALVYVCEHSGKGALGLVVNRPTDLTLGSLLDKIDLNQDIQVGMDAPVYFGGPVQSDRGFVLHQPAGKYASSLPLAGMALTTSRDELEAVAEGKGPDRLLVALGYAGWGAGQLEAELAADAWHVTDIEDSILFDLAPESRWAATMARDGIDPARIAVQGGRA